MERIATKKELALRLGIPRRTLYYTSKKAKNDWKLKGTIEEVLHEHPSYGHRRIALHLSLNKKRIRRVMRLYGIKPYRRRTKKQWKKPKEEKNIYTNLLLRIVPTRPHMIWASDFTFVVTNVCSFWGTGHQVFLTDFFKGDKISLRNKRRVGKKFIKHF